MSNKFYEVIQDNPIIAAIKNQNMLEDVLKSPVEIIFLLNGELFTLKETVKKIKDAKKLVYVHIDLIDGLSKSVAALKYIKDEINPDGIITTKSSLIKAAKDLGFFTIQRFFIVDSLSLKKSYEIIKNVKPNAIEMLPGIIPSVVKQVAKNTNTPLITGGLVNTKEDIVENLKSGADGVSTTNKELWYM
ncbi:glycerol-3-phosphate responsive antiterminator [Haliovirga abyssi]|uniref:Glycerol uptake operon antiterminator n=1 Tax=Haliovirga abyssi TaxID=2996794 RepID=A0AAU9E0H0_9FUSO|nr:glycerol-3-phosphate responsive antiterminator [Haliovirga abyssi]BDU51395.1 glycerol uptake operon antiterminator [Haliovirga abyssi]